MAIEYYSSIDLNQNELQFPVLHKLASPPTSPSATEGQLYYDSSAGEKTVYVFDGSNWINIGQNSITNYATDTISSGDFLAFSDESQTGDVNNKITVDNYIKTAPALTTEATLANGDYMLFLDGGATGEMKKEALADVATLFAGAGMTATSSVLNVIAGDGITVAADAVAVTAANTNITSVLNASLKVGRDAHNLVDFSTDNAITLRIADNNELTFDGTNFFPVSDTGMHLGKDGNAFKSLNLGDIDGDASSALIRFEKSRAGDTVTDNDDIGKFSFFAMNDAGSAEEVEFGRWLVEAHDNADGHENARASFKFMAGGALANGIKFTGQSDDTLDVEIGDGAASTVTIPGNLVVTGTTTTNNVETISTSSGVVFEGTTGDGNDATLKSVVAGSDKTYTLPNTTGFIGIFTTDPGTTNISATTAELNALDLGSTAVGNAIASKAVVLDSSKDFTGINILTSDNYVIGGHTIDDIDITSEFVDADAHIMSSKAIGARFAQKNADTTGTATNATNAAHVLITDNENTNEENEITFIEGAGGGGANRGLEADGDFTYNPSSGTVSATIFKGNIDAVDGDFDGTLETDALTIAGTAIVAQATASAVGGVELATAAEVLTGTDTARVVTADTLSAKSVVAVIDVSSLTDANIVTIPHNLGTADVMVQVYDITTEANIMCDIARTTDDFSTASTSSISIDFGTAPPNDCRCLITSLKGASASGTVAYT